MEGAHAVLYAVKIGGRLSADGGIHLRKKGGGHVIKVDTAHKGGGGKARKVTHNASAHGYHRIGAGKTVVQHHTASISQIIKCVY